MGALRRSSEHHGHRYIYAGHSAFENATYDVQRGFDGSFAFYFSGHGYLLSLPLAAAVADLSDPPTPCATIDPRTHTSPVPCPPRCSHNFPPTCVLRLTPPRRYYHMEARCQDDCMLGRWVRRVEVQRNLSVHLAIDDTPDGGRGHHGVGLLQDLSSWRWWGWAEGERRR